MNFINRAFKNVTRKISKSILLVITFFVIGNLVIIGLGVASAAENAKTLTRKKMRAVVNYNVDYEAFWEYADSIEDEQEREELYNDYPSIKISDVKALMQDERVTTTNALVTGQGYLADGYTFVKLNNSAEEYINEHGQQCWMLEDGSQECSEYIDAMHYIKANIFPNMIEFVDGGFSIVDGRFYNQEEIDSGAKVVLISKALAEVNNLKVGDKYAFYTTSPYELQWYGDIDIDPEQFLQECEIVGIYDHQNKITPDSADFEYTYPADNFDNMLLMPATTLTLSENEFQKIIFNYYAQLYPDDIYYSDPNNMPSDDLNVIAVYDVIFLLNDPLDVEQFVEDNSKNLPRFMKLDANNEEFDRLAKPLDTLSLYSNFIIWLVVVNAVIIISLVTALTLKTREYEIGVLLSIGASKVKVIGQFFIELALVAIVGFTLAIGSGSLIANKVGQTVLEYQIQESDLDENNNGRLYADYSYIWDTDYTTDITLDDLVSEYTVSVSPLIIGEIYVLGLGIVLVSIVVPSMMIMRFNPKKILMNQY